MNHNIKKSLVVDLVPACERGEIEDIMEVMNSYFYQLKSARSIFCVDDAKQLKEFLPKDAVIGAKGYLHSFFNSRQITTVKNQGEGGGFQYTYTIALDTNFPSYLRSYDRGTLNGSLREVFVDSLKYLAPHRSGVAITPYLYENADQINDPKVYETIKCYIDFIHADDEKLQNDGEIVSTISDDATSEVLANLVKMVNDGVGRVLAKQAKINMQVAYLVLLIGVNVRFTYPNKGDAFIMRKLLEGLSSTLGSFPQVELYLIIKYLEKSNREDFFNSIDPLAKKLLPKLKNMAWDLSLHRTIHENVALMARVNEEHADFVVPYMFTFDSPLNTLLSKLKYNGLITYKDNGVKSVCLYPQKLYDGMEKFAIVADEFSSDKEYKARAGLGKQYFTNPSRRKRLIKLAEANLKRTMEDV